MNYTILIDWKFVVALGGVAVGTIFALKMEPSAIERVSIHAIDTCEGLVAAKSSR